MVEDFEPIRRLIVSILQTRPGLQFIFQSADGLEAVEKAAELRPDVILLDISLPNLNGIEAARRIRQVSPGSKLLFVTQESSSDVVQEALNLGARGYVAKIQLGTELLPAIEAVLRGQHFISAGLLPIDPSEIDPDHAYHTEVLETSELRFSPYARHEPKTT